MTQVGRDKASIHLTNFTRLEKQVNGARRRRGWTSCAARHGPVRAVGFPPDEERGVAAHERRRRSPKTQFEPGRRRTTRPRRGRRAEQFTLRRRSGRASWSSSTGSFRRELSRIGKLPRGVTVGSLADGAGGRRPAVRAAPRRSTPTSNANPFVALNTASSRDGAFVHLPRGDGDRAADPPAVHLDAGGRADGRRTRACWWSRKTTSRRRSSRATSARDGGSLLHQRRDRDRRRRGLPHRSLQAPAGDRSTAYPRRRRCRCSSAAATTFVSHAATIGGKLTRNDLNCHRWPASGAYATLNGLVLIGGEQHCDNHTLLDHAEPNCPSHELYKHVLDGKATGVFKGKILVQQDAQKTDSKQTSKTLLLSDDAYDEQPAGAGDLRRRREVHARQHDRPGG